MERILDFLIETGKLKKMPRTGFVWLGIKKPETIGQHLFRVALLNWILGRNEKPKLNLEKLIKISLAHDLCEVYAGDMTPYWGLLPKDKKKRVEILKRWIRLSRKEKEKRDKIKFQKEKKALKKLLKNLPLDLQKEIEGYWLDYERTKTKEGKFAKQGDKIETLIQAFEYWGSKKDTPVKGWWEEVLELVDNPLLLKFLKNIEKSFYQSRKESPELEFILKVGQLKNKERSGWVLRGVKNAETIAESSFLTAVAVWILSKLAGKKLSQSKILKMALVFEICEVYAGDITPYEGLITEKNKKEILKRWPRFLRKEKEKRFWDDYKREKEALKKLVARFPLEFKKEIISLWDDCKRRLTAEGRFVNQVYWLTTYLQALQYFKEDKEFPILGWYEQMKEFIEDPFLLEIMTLMERRFLPKRIKI